MKTIVTACAFAVLGGAALAQDAGGALTSGPEFDRAVAAGVCDPSNVAFVTVLADGAIEATCEEAEAFVPLVGPAVAGVVAAAVVAAGGGGNGTTNRTQ